MLEELAKKNSKWLSMALKLCGNKQLSKDVVQDMYIRMYDISLKFPDKEIKDTYVWVVICTLLNDIHRKNSKYKMVSLDCVMNKHDTNEPFELSDEDLLLLSRANELRYLTRYYIEKSYDHSLRGLAELNGAKYWDINRKLKEGREHILKDRIDEYKNKRNKRK